MMTLPGQRKVPPCRLRKKQRKQQAAEAPTTATTDDTTTTTTTNRGGQRDGKQSKQRSKTARWQKGKGHRRGREGLEATVAIYAS